MLTPSADPELSAILITPERYATLQKAVACLHAQSVRDRIELVIVAPDRDHLGLLASACDGFHGCQVVEVGAMDSTGEMMGAGVRAATAPIVVYVEEHSFPAVGWAESLIAAHNGRWAAVGPAVRNANPATGTSWAALFLEFGTWVPPAAAGEMRLLPAHQTSYKKAVLLRYGSALDALLESESALQAALLRDGHQLYFEPAAATDHVNVSRPGDLMMCVYLGYRMFASDRAEHGGWSPWHRALYIGGSPLLPALRMYRTLREVSRTRRLGQVGLKMVLPLLLASFAAMTGEVVGYTFGAGRTARKRLAFELNRLRYVTEADERELRG